MANMNTSHRYIYDAAPATLLRARGLDPLQTVDENLMAVFEGTVELDHFEGRRYVSHTPVDETLAVVVNVDHLLSDGRYELSIDLTTRTDAAFSLVTDVIIRKIGQYVFLIDVPTMRNLVPAYDGNIKSLTLRMNALNGQLPPDERASISFHAFITAVKA